MTKYVALFYPTAEDGDPSRSEEFEAATREDAQEVANGMLTTELRVEVHHLPDGLSNDLAIGKAASRTEGSSLRASFALPSRQTALDSKGKRHGRL